MALQPDHLGDTRGDRVLGVHSHLLSERIIYIVTAINAGVTNALIGQRLFLESDSPHPDVQLSVNCDGGDPRVMLAVYDTMRFIRPAIATTYVGQAIGTDAVLLAAGAEGRCSALPRARVVLADEAVRIRAEIETSSLCTAARVSTDCEPARITTASSRPVRPSSSGSRTTLSRDADARR